MSGPVVFQMWMLLLLGITSKVVKAHVSPAQVIRRNVRSDDLYRKEESINVTPLGGIIHSPRYPNAYPRCLLLSWKLLSPPGTRIHLDFDRHFNLEEGENGVCRYDFIEVEDQSETSTIIWGRWCGERPPPTVISKTNSLKVTFKSDDYFVAKPGFKIYYTMMAFDEHGVPTAVTEAPLSLEDLDQTIANFDTIEDLLKTLNPDTWKQDLDNIYTQPYIQYRSRAYHLMSRHNKVDLNRLYDDVKRYSCTPRNYSVNLREELRVTNAVFFPRCLLVKRCGGNCGCGTDNWNNGCTCQASKTTLKLHEVLKYAPETNLSQRPRRPRARWVIDEVFLTHHEKCECACPSQPPR